MSLIFVFVSMKNGLWYYVDLDTVFQCVDLSFCQYKKRWMKLT